MDGRGTAHSRAAGFRIGCEAASQFDKGIGEALGVRAFGMYQVELPPGVIFASGCATTSGTHTVTRTVAAPTVTVTSTKVATSSATRGQTPLNPQSQPIALGKGLARALQRAMRSKVNISAASTSCTQKANAFRCGCTSEDSNSTPVFWDMTAVSGRWTAVRQPKSQQVSVQAAAYPYAVSGAY